MVVFYELFEIIISLWGIIRMKWDKDVWLIIYILIFMYIIFKLIYV